MLDENAFLGHARTDVVGAALAAIWPHLSDSELASVLDKIDQDASGSVTFDELLAFFAHHCTRCAVLAPYLPSRMCRRLLLLLAAC